MLDGEQLKGFIVVADVCAEALVNLPNEKVIGNVAQVAEALGVEGFSGVEATPDLEQRYYDRFFVSSHGAYVPLYEDCVRSGAEEDGRFRYAAMDGRFYEHTLKCYQAVGFDYRLIEGFELSVKKLKSDSLVSELAFLVFLAQSAIDLRESDPAASQRSVELLEMFARDHANRWFGRAADCLARFEDDFYAKVAALAADAVAVMVPDESASGAGAEK